MIHLSQEEMASSPILEHQDHIYDPSYLYIKHSFRIRQLFFVGGIVFADM